MTTIEIAYDARNAVGEGPFWDEREQAIWWVDIPAKRINRLVPLTGAFRSWSAPEFPSAVMLKESGGAIVAMRDGVYGFDPATGAFEVLCRPDAERPDNRSNEAKCDPAGRLFHGTMQNNLNPDGSDRKMSGSFGALYRVEPDGRFHMEVDDIGLSNTLAWTADGRTCYFGDTRLNRIDAYDVAADGSLSNRRPFTREEAPGHCDGSTIDAEGYLWNARFAGSCLVRWAPDGTVDRIVKLPVTNPTSCCFGGPDLRTLYVTSARGSLGADHLAANPQEGALLALDGLGVTGTPSQRFAG